MADMPGLNPPSPPPPPPAPRFTIEGQSKVIIKAAAPTAVFILLQAHPFFRAGRAAHKILDVLIPSTATQYFTFEVGKRLVTPVDYAIESLKAQVGLQGLIPNPDIAVNPQAVLDYFESIGQAINDIGAEAFQDIQDIELDLRRAVGLAEGQSRLRGAFSDVFEFVTNHDKNIADTKAATASFNAWMQGALDRPLSQAQFTSYLDSAQVNLNVDFIAQSVLSDAQAQTLAARYINDMMDATTGIIRSFPTDKEDP